MGDDLRERLEAYKRLRDEKKRAEDYAKDIGKEFTAATKDLADAMAEADEPTITDGAYSYSIVPKTAYSFLSQEKLDDMGMDKFDVLRENGLGDLITERVDPRSLSKCLNDMAEVGESIPVDVLAITSKYDYNDISRTKVSAKKQQSLAKAKQNLG